MACFAIAILAKAPTHQSAKFVFATFYDGTGADTENPVGWSMRASPAYGNLKYSQRFPVVLTLHLVAICGVLMSQYTITG